MSTISDFKNNFRGGVRPNLYKVVVSAPAIFGAMDLQFLGKATQIPGSVIGNIDVAYRGRMLKVPGDRTFEDWTVTILNDPDWQNRTAIEQWMNSITNHSQNRTSTTAAGVYGNASVTQLSREGRAVRTYRLQDIYPTTLTAIELAMDPDGAPEEFAVTFAVNNYTVDGQGLDGSTTNGVDVSISGSISLGGVTISV
ncbi:MAG: hypothetical protein CL464_10955 [Acidimicrobiaceae bacterium]|jgi:hypothetical protein|nr:hypothetical protein [Acidimicrobiaceae bacterium]|tara:strand:- start:187 stop:777 length:591 start_codon:yes stop_codon:yes gene_type:complete